MCKRLMLGLEVGQDSPVMTVSNPDTRETLVRVVLLDRRDIEHARRLLSIAEQWINFKEAKDGRN